MTGFARTEGAFEAWTWAVEARSVNGRGLEVRYRGPPGFDGLERLLREAAQARFHRGQINVTVQATRAAGVAGGVRVNLEVLERYIAISETFVAEGRVAPPALDGLLALRGVIEQGEDDDSAGQPALEAAVAASALAALNGLKLAREAEGEAVQGLLSGFLGEIEALCGAARGEAGTQPDLIKERFTRRMAELIGEGADEDRIVQEAAVMAVRADVREELDRLASHIATGRNLLSGERAAGRRLDFLTQELLREANTLCAKSASTALTAIGLDLKAEIDRFREQAQNVE